MRVAGRSARRRRRRFDLGVVAQRRDLIQLGAGSAPRTAVHGRRRLSVRGAARQRPIADAREQAATALGQSAHRGVGQLGNSVHPVRAGAGRSAAPSRSVVEQRRSAGCRHRNSISSARGCAASRLAIARCGARERRRAGRDTPTSFVLPFVTSIGRQHRRQIATSGWTSAKHISPRNSPGGAGGGSWRRRARQVRRRRRRRTQRRAGDAEGGGATAERRRRRAAAWRDRGSIVHAELVKLGTVTAATAAAGTLSQRVVDHQHGGDHGVQCVLEDDRPRPRRRENYRPRARPPPG